MHEAIYIYTHTQKQSRYKEHRYVSIIFPTTEMNTCHALNYLQQETTLCRQTFALMLQEMHYK